MSLKRPSAVVTIDGRQLNAAEAALLSLKVELASAGAHDGAVLELWPDSKFADVSVGATLAIALGDKDAEIDVLAGEVGAVRSTPRGVKVEGVSATIGLSRTFTSQTYLDQSVSDIVNDLASAVSIDQVDASMKLAAYHADGGRSVWTHLQMLARLTGSRLGSAADGSLRFVPADGAASPVTLRYGADLLDWDFAQVSAASPPAATAHGAGSEAGAAKWHWLRHNPGGGSPVRVVGAIATKDAADLASKAIEGRAARAAVRGRLAIVGNASIRPGDAVQLEDLPGTDPGALLVVGCRHTLDSIGGFVTSLTVEAGTGGGLPL